MSSSSDCLVNKHAAGIVIIGASSETFIYASILIKQHLNIPITIIVPGVNHLDKFPYLDDASFPLDNLRYKLAFLHPSKIRYCTPGLSVLTDTTDYQGLSNISLLYTGQGPCGNYLYIPPMDFGPWFDSEVEQNATSFLKFVTHHAPYTHVETAVTQYIQATFNLATYSDQGQGIYRPSVTYRHRFLRGEVDNKGNYRRNYFQFFYNLVKEATIKGGVNINLYAESSQLSFSPGSSTNLYNINFMAGHTTPISLSNQIVIWKTFHTTYQQLAVQGGLNPNRSRVPTSYRAVIPMSLAAAKLDNIPPDHLTITSRGTFSLPDISTGEQSVICWLVSYYTTQQDIVTDHIADTTNSDAQCLLVVEGLCRGNQREVGYNLYSEQNEVYLNNPELETRFMCDFRNIVSVIYTGYTGQPIPAFPNTGEICQGTCITNKYYTSQPPTQILPLIALNTIISIYNNYPGYRVPGGHLFSH